jgi:hypothetical protein
MPKTVQAKHVPELAILQAMARHADGKWWTHWPYNMDDPGDPWSLLTAVPELAAFPDRVLRAKLGTLVRRGLLDGCDCGCRGDWVILPKGREALARMEGT